MNIDDIYGAMDDLTEYHALPNTEVVHTVGRAGTLERINGFDVVDGHLYVISSDGKPAVDSRVIDDYNDTIRNLDAYVDSLRYGIFEKVSAEDVADELTKLITELERKVGDIT